MKFLQFSLMVLLLSTPAYSGLWTGRMIFKRNVGALYYGITGNGTYSFCGIIAGVYKCAGINNDGEFGNGSINTTTKNYIGINTGITNIEEFYSKDSSTKVFKKDNTLYCFGKNNNGQCGVSLTTYPTITTPVAIPNMDSGVTKVCSIDQKTYVIKNNSLYGMGLNIDGASGLTKVDTPTLISGFESNVTDIFCGPFNTCVLQNGSLKCFGQFYGKNDGTSALVTISSSNAFVPISDAIEYYPNMDSPSTYMFKTSSNGLKCWGYSSNTNGCFSGLVNGYITTAVNPYTSGVKKVYRTSSNMRCIDVNNILYCTGSTMLMPGITYTSPYFTNSLLSIVADSSTVKDVVINKNNSAYFCILYTTNMIKCTGNQANGLLGNHVTGEQNVINGNYYRYYDGVNTNTTVPNTITQPFYYTWTLQTFEYQP